MKKVEKILDGYRELSGKWGDNIYLSAIALILKRNDIQKISLEKGQDIIKKIKSIEIKERELLNKILDEDLKYVETDILLEAINRLLKCSEEELIEEILTENLACDDEMNNLFSYDNLNELCIKLLDIQDKKKVLCINDNTSIIQGIILNNYNVSVDVYNHKIKQGNEFRMRRNAIDISSTVRKYAIRKEANYLNMDISTDDFERKYDFAIASSDMLETDKKDDIKKIIQSSLEKLNIENIKERISADYIIAIKMLNALKDNGRGIMLFDTTSLSNISGREIRKQLIEKNYIEGIIKIRSENNYTSYSIVIFNKLKKDNSIKIYDAEKEIIYIDCYYEFDIDNILKKYNSNNISISKEKIIENEYSLNTNLYIKVPNFNDGRKLGEVIDDMFRGYQISKNELQEMKVFDEEKANYKILEIGSINDEGEIFQKLTMINSGSKNLDRYLLQDGDIVITARGDKIKIAYVELKENERIIANGSINVIRTNKQELNPKYLKIFFESQIGKKTLENIKIGYTTPSLNTGDLKRIIVPCPWHMDIQNDLVKEYDKNKIKIKKIQNEIQELINTNF